MCKNIKKETFNSILRMLGEFSTRYIKEKLNITEYELRKNYKEIKRLGYSEIKGFGGSGCTCYGYSYCDCGGNPHVGRYTTISKKGREYLKEIGLQESCEKCVYIFVDSYEQKKKLIDGSCNCHSVCPCGFCETDVEQCINCGDYQIMK